MPRGPIQIFGAIFPITGGSGPGSATPDATGKVYSVSGLKPGSTALLYGNGSQIATTTVDASGKATWTLANKPAAGVVVTWEGTVTGPAGTVQPDAPNPGAPVGTLDFSDPAQSGNHPAL